MRDRIVVLLHGYAGRPDAWRRVIDAWPSPAPTFQAIALPGHGQDSLPLGDSFDAAVDAVVERLPKTEAVHLVGYSLGGRLALGAATAHPDRIERLSLIGANPGIPDDERAARRANDESWAKRLESEGLERFIDAWSDLPIFATQRRLPEDYRREQLSWRTSLDAQQLASAMRQMSLAAMPDYRPALSNLDLPVQLIVGALDAKFQSLARLMQAVLPRSELHSIPGAGHNVPLEAPKALAARLSAFDRA